MKIDRNPIERLHMVDLDVVVRSDGPGGELETVRDACTELTTGLLVQFSVLIDVGPAGGWPVVRFTGPRNQLEELLNRYHGVAGAFAPSPWTPPESVANIA